MRYLGDVHGMWYAIPRDGVPTIQVGDLGVGFTNGGILPTDFRFVRGNHDNPNLCRRMPEYLGEFGYYNEDTFFISGAASDDYNLRIPGYDYWADEELNQSQWYNVLEMYHGARVIVSHDCPQFVCNYLWGYNPTLTRTGLDFVFQQSAPELWIFGHHHKSIQWRYGRTLFVCLGEIEIFHA